MSVKLLTFEQIYLNVTKIEQYLYSPLKITQKGCFYGMLVITQTL